MSEITLRMNDGTLLVVPASLDAITTYVCLEQEKWFEKEIDFVAAWLKPGMTAIDIGANLGVYSLPMARLVGPDGHVFAYEPSSETCRLLRISKKKNKASNLHLIPMALSDSERTGKLTFGASSELNTLEGSGPGEAVQIATLDSEDVNRGWEAVDFLKIDAEGEEERILAGGKAFLARHQPLILFEVKNVTDTSASLRAALAAEGHGIFRLLGGAPILVPVADDETIDAFELNLFAARPERAAKLADAGFLADTVMPWTPDASLHQAGIDFIKQQVFASPFGQLMERKESINDIYLNALAAYAAWRSAENTLATRVGALAYASKTLTDLCIKDPSLARLSTLARVTWEFGQRNVSVNALKMLSTILKNGTGRMTEPFWPAGQRFDSIAPRNQVMEWFVVSAMEPLEQMSSFSSISSASLVDLDWLAAQPFASAEIERRKILRRARAGQKVDVPRRLLVPAADHVNAENWRGGIVPNTRVE